MDYNDVALFVRVVTAGSFTRAAAEVGLPKSSASRSVARLEKELGVRLLQRTTRRLVLTEAGQGYFDSIRGAVTGIDEAEKAVRELGAEPRGLVRVTAPLDLGTIDLAAALTRFTRKYPGIRIEMSFTSRVVDLVAEGFDLAIRAGKLEDSSLIVRRIGADEAALFAAPSYLRRRGKPKTTLDLAAHDWVLYRAHGGHSVISLTGPDGAEKTVEVTGPLVADELSFCRAAAEAGAGIVFLPIQLAFEAVSTGRLEQVLPGFLLRGGSINIVLPSRQLPTRVALVRDLLVECLTNMLAEGHQRCAKGEQKGRRGT